MNNNNKKIITILPVLATILSAAASTTTPIVAYGQDWLIGSPDVPVQIDPEHASPPLVPSSPPPQPPTSPTPTPQQQLPPSTTTPTPGAPGTPQDPAVIIDRPTAARLAAEDPYFAQFEQVLNMCMEGVLSGTVTITATQCASSMQQGADRWCGLEFFDALKCEYATKMVTEFNKMAGILSSFGLEELPSFEELAPGQPNPFLTPP